MTAVDVEHGYRAPAVCKATGVNYRRLDYWTRIGHVAPSIHSGSGSGDWRIYSLDDVVRVATIERLITAGLALGAAAQLAESWKDQDGASIEVVSGVRLVVDLAAIRADVVRNLAPKHRRARVR